MLLGARVFDMEQAFLIGMDVYLFTFMRIYMVYTYVGIYLCVFVDVCIYVCT